MAVKNFVSAFVPLLAEVPIQFAAAIAVCTGIGAAIAMGMAISKAMEGIARQPEASGKIQAILLIGLAFIETTALYGFVIAIMMAGGSGS